MTLPHDLATWPTGTADKAAELAADVGLPLLPWQRDVLARIEAAPPAPESFTHLDTCEATDDAPGVCECPPAVLDVLAEVTAERARQDEKWGEQNHPDLSPWVQGGGPAIAAAVHGLPSASRAKRATDTAAGAGTVSWAHIAIEELAEAVEAAALGDLDALRTEVVQLAAVCVQWAQAIDRRGADR